MAFHAAIAELSLSWNSGSFTLSRSNFGGADFGRGGCETGFAAPADGGVVEAGRCKSLASRPLFEGTARGRPRVSSGALVKKAVMLPVSFAVAAVDCAGALLAVHYQRVLVRQDLLAYRAHHGRLRRPLTITRDLDIVVVLHVCSANSSIAE